jgi:hypothetical protein
MTTADPRARQLAESRYRNGYGPTLAEPWEKLNPDVRQDHVNEAAAWLRSAVAAGLMPPTDSRAGALTDAVGALEAHLESFFCEHPEERQNSPWVLGWKDATAELRRLVTEDASPPAVEDLAAADNPTPLRWGLDDVLWCDDESVIVLLSGPDREPYWLELDPERAAVLRQNLAGPEGEAQQPETQAHPSRDRWYIEILDGDGWDLTSRFHTERDAAVRDMDRRNGAAPQWDDGKPVRRRLVRETTTHTVESAVSQPGKEA